MKKDSTLLREVINTSTKSVIPDKTMKRKTGWNHHFSCKNRLFFFMVKKKTPGLFKPGV